MITKPKIAILVIILFFSAAMIASPTISYAVEENKPKEYCKEYGGEWDDKKGICEIEDDEEKAAYEDYVCDDPDDSDRYSKICKPWLFDDNDNEDDKNNNNDNDDDNDKDDGDDDNEGNDSK